jgi:hypothetical protein
MAKRTRRFLFISMSVLAAGLGTGLVASYVDLGAARGLVGNAPEELAYVPAEGRLIAFVNVRDLMNSPLGQNILGSASGHRTNNDSFEVVTGINVENDIDRVVASFADAVREGQSDTPLVLARGRFDEARIERLVRGYGGQATQYRGTRLLSYAESSDRRTAIAFVEPGLVAFGPELAVKRSIDAKNTALDVTTNPALMALVRDVDDGNLWAVGRFDELTTRAKVPQGVVEQLPPINWFAASGRIDTAFHALLRAEARDEAAAQELRDVLKGFIALARVRPGGGRDVAALMNSLEIGGEGKTVSLLFSAPPDALGVLERFSR